MKQTHRKEKKVLKPHLLHRSICIICNNESKCSSAKTNRLNDHHQCHFQANDLTAMIPLEESIYNTPRPTKKKKTRGANTQRKTETTMADRDPPPPPLIRLTPDNPRFSAIPIQNYENSKSSNKSNNGGVRERRIILGIYRRRRREI